MSDFLGWIDAAAGMSPQLRARLLQSALGVLLLWGLHRLILHLRARRSVDPASLYRWRKTSSYVTFGIGVVLITFESNWQAGKQIIGRIAALHAEHLSGAAEKRRRRAVHRFMISYGNLTPIVYTSVRDCGVLLTARYLCEPRQRRSVQEKIWEDVLVAFAARDDIDFAYPTTRFYDNASEGKPGRPATAASWRSGTSSSRPGTSWSS